MSSNEPDKYGEELIDRSTDRNRRSVCMRRIVVDHVDALISTLGQRRDQRFQRQPCRGGRHTAERFIRPAFEMNFALPALRKNLRFGLRCIVGPDEKPRRDGRKFFDQLPRFRQVI